MDEADAARVVGEVPEGPRPPPFRARPGHALRRASTVAPNTVARPARGVGGALRPRSRPASGGLAHHFCEAGRGVAAGRAVDYARRAGDRALTQLAYEEAIRLYRLALRALELQEPADERAASGLLLSLGDAGTRAGDAPSGRRGSARPTPRDGSVTLNLARAALGYGGRFVWARAADDRTLVPLLEDALKHLGDEASPLRARLMARLAGALRDELDGGRRATLSAKAVAMARQLTTTPRWRTLGRYSAIWGRTRPTNGSPSLTRSSRAEEIGDDERAFRATTAGWRS